MDRNLDFEKWLQDVELQIRLTKPLAYIADYPEQPLQQWFTDDMAASEAAKLIVAGLNWA